MWLIDLPNTRSVHLPVVILFMPERCQRLWEMEPSRACQKLFTEIHHVLTIFYTFKWYQKKYRSSCIKEGLNNKSITFSRGESRKAFAQDDLSNPPPPLGLVNDLWWGEMRRDEPRATQNEECTDTRWSRGFGKLRWFRSGLNKPL